MKRIFSQEEKMKIRKSFRNSFFNFFIQGFVMINLGVTSGLSYAEGISSKILLIFYICQPLICMYIAYSVSSDLFYKGCTFKEKNWLHYLYAGYFVLAFGFGFLYYNYPIVIPILCVIGLYCFAICFELIYWKRYMNVYYIDFLYRYIKLVKKIKGILNENY